MLYIFHCDNRKKSNLISNKLENFHPCKEITIFVLCINCRNCFQIIIKFTQVIDKPEKEETLDYLEKILTHKYAGKSGIIYAQTIKDCEDLALALKQRGLKIAPYHANLDHSDKHKVHERWLNNKYQVVVATIAFGMGIGNFII